MGKPTDDDDEPVPMGIDKENRLTYRLGQRGVEMEKSTKLDIDFKIDALITGIRNIRGPHEPIGLQLTQRRGAWKKIRRFVKCASKATRGPLLYVEIDGRITERMAMGLKKVLISLWLDPDMKKKRARGCVIDAAGHVRWFDIEQP